MAYIINPYYNPNKNEGYTIYSSATPHVNPMAQRGGNQTTEHHGVEFIVAPFIVAPSLIAPQSTRESWRSKLKQTE